MTNKRQWCHPPQLRYDNEWDRWVLHLPQSALVGYVGDGPSYAMVITHAWDGEKWDNYRFIAWIDGEVVELKTKAEIEQMVADVREHEGDEVAEIWRTGQDCYLAVPDDHKVFDLRRHWDAIVALDLITLTVNHREWKGRDLPAECVARMDACRDRQMRETIAEMTAGG